MLPAHAPAQSLGLVKARRSDESESGVASCHMRRMSDRVGEHGTAATRAPRPVFHVRSVEEPINDDLPASLEEIQQGDLTLRPDKAVVSIDLRHRQSPALGNQAITRLHMRLFLLEKLFT